MKLTKKQAGAVFEDVSTTVAACPGAGKTRTLIAKLVQVAKEVSGSSRRIACITYTNAAVHEIEGRLNKNLSVDLADLCDISTIHGFCLNNILKKYHWMIPQLKNGYEIVTPDSEEFKALAGEICQEFGLNRSSVNSFEQLYIRKDGTPKVPFDISTEAADEFWRRLHLKSLIDFPSLVWFSYSILMNNKNLARAISSKYKWILVDEFQDTSDIQLEMFKLINDSKRTNFFLVGDKNQSIYSFAGANPENIVTFSDHISSKNSERINENFRSSSAVVNLANALIVEASLPMISVSEHKDLDVIPEYIHTHNVQDVVLNHFLKRTQELNIKRGDIAVLAPWWINLLHLGRAMREQGLPITGPGARPYRRSHFIAPFVEQLCVCLTDVNQSQMFKLKKQFEEILQIFGRSFNLSSYEKRVYINKVFRFSKSASLRFNSTQEWLLVITNFLCDILIKDFGIRGEDAELLIDSAKEILTEMRANNIDPSYLSLKDFTLFSSNEDSIKLITLHRAKGREFDAVAIINVNDNRIPHFSAQTQEEIDEARRLLYVGITRAKKYLLIISDMEDRRNRPSRFLDQLLLTPYLKKIG